jgi:hypothetical protein
LVDLQRTRWNHREMKSVRHSSQEERHLQEQKDTRTTRQKEELLFSGV